MQRHIGLEIRMYYFNNTAELLKVGPISLQLLEDRHVKPWAKIVGIYYLHTGLR